MSARVRLLTRQSVRGTSARQGTRAQQRKSEQRGASAQNGVQQRTRPGAACGAPRSVRIGRLQYRDIAQLVHLNALADATEHALLPDLVAPRIDRRSARRYWSSQVFARDARTLVARVGALTVGMIGADLKRARHRYAVLKRHIYLHSLFVLPQWRGAGVARRLIRQALHWSRRRGATHVALEKAVPNAAARRLYGAFGFVPRETRFTLALVNVQTRTQTRALVHTPMPTRSIKHSRVAR